MEMDSCKLFIGGISWETSEDRLRDYFQSFGEVLEAVIMKDRATGRARGFGFIVFAHPNVAERVVFLKHVIDGKIVSFLSKHHTTYIASNFSLADYLLHFRGCCFSKQSYSLLFIPVLVSTLFSLQSPLSKQAPKPKEKEKELCLPLINAHLCQMLFISHTYTQITNDKLGSFHGSALSDLPYSHVQESGEESGSQ